MIMIRIAVGRALIFQKNLMKHELQARCVKMYLDDVILGPCGTNIVINANEG